MKAFKVCTSCYHSGFDSVSLARFFSCRCIYLKVSQ